MTCSSCHKSRSSDHSALIQGTEPHLSTALGNSMPRSMTDTLQHDSGHTLPVVIADYVTKNGKFQIVSCIITCLLVDLAINMKLINSCIPNVLANLPFTRVHRDIRDSLSQRSRWLWKITSSKNCEHFKTSRAFLRTSSTMLSAENERKCSRVLGPWYIWCCGLITLWSCNDRELYCASSKSRIQVSNCANVSCNQVTVSPSGCDGLSSIHNTYVCFLSPHFLLTLFGKAALTTLDTLSELYMLLLKVWARLSCMSENFTLFAAGPSTGVSLYRMSTMWLQSLSMPWCWAAIKIWCV